MAYDAAVVEEVPQPLIDLYISQSIKRNLAWYAEAGLLTRAAFADLEDAAFESALPHMDSYVGRMGVDAFARAPIVSDAKWAQFVQSLDTFESPETCLENDHMDDAPRIRNRLLSLGRQVLLVSLSSATSMTLLDADDWSSLGCSGTMMPPTSSDVDPTLDSAVGLVCNARNYIKPSTTRC